MSLFPAYGGKAEGGENPTTTTSAWKTNKSYEQNLDTEEKDSGESSKEGEEKSEESSSEEESSPPVQEPIQKPAIPQQELEFDGNDSFYVDKNKNNSYRSEQVRCLTKPTRPRYRIRMKRLWDARRRRDPHWDGWKPVQGLRYIKGTPQEKISPAEQARLQEQLMQSRVMVQKEPRCLEHWLQLHRLLDLNLDKANRLAVSEHQLHCLETALEHHPSNEQLLQLYTETASAAYPASQVAVLIERMLEKNPFEYTLWTALIMATQGTMARCNVPDVLRIFEESMRRMHLGHTDAESRKFDSVDTDGIMMKLFYHCCQFFRQSSNSNHMFALLRLAFELNFPGQTLDCLEANAADERPLIEFEELVLKSGMPLPEIWTRVERLRQAYNYLPYPQLQHSDKDTVEGALDPQRCVFSDDVCHYAYPLKAQSNRLHLLLLIVQLTKMPLSRSECLAEALNTRLEQFGDSDAIEMMLASLTDRSTYAVPLERSAEFMHAMVDLVKEMCVTPSFMPHCIASELYMSTISKLLLKCSEAIQSEEKPRRVFILLWFRFQRLVLIIRKVTGKLQEPFLKVSRLLMRKLLRCEENRKVTRFYTELILCEFEMLDGAEDPKRVLTLFTNLVENEARPDESLSCPDLMHAYMTFAEMLVSRNQREPALHILCCLSLGLHATHLGQEAALRRLQDAPQSGESLLQKELDKLEELPTTMPLEEYFLSNKLLILLRARCLTLCLLCRSREADELLQQLLQGQLSVGKAKISPRRRFLREQVTELLMVTLQLPIPPPQIVTMAAPNLKEEMGEDEDELPRCSQHARSHLLVEVVDKGLTEFPRNLALLQRWATFNTMQWHKLRARFIRTQAGVLSVLHLVIASRCRFAETMRQQEEEGAGCFHCHIQTAVRNRVLSMFETFLPTNPNRSDIEAEQYQLLRRNSLFWRSYLRCLSDTRTSFERSKQCLLVALDECPWDKSLYLDGAIHVPQELAHLQDVMTEKQLRIYALPEELDILRG
ncbi:hypothetical protein KR009_009248 [Drosophila setifemur]|nr:hypothetical protein KR009_009248 [Drosophila setifemur]